MFDLFASEYGWTFDYIWTLTTREVAATIKKINERTERRIEFEYKLHGFKVEKIEPSKFSKEDDTAVNQAYERLKREREWQKSSRSKS